MEKILYSGLKICEILHLPRLSKATLIFFLKKGGKPQGERPVLFAIESYLTDGDEFRLLCEFGTVTTGFEMGVCLALEGCRVQPKVEVMVVSNTRVPSMESNIRSVSSNYFLWIEPIVWL